MQFSKFSSGSAGAVQNRSHDVKVVSGSTSFAVNLPVKPNAVDRTMTPTSILKQLSKSGSVSKSVNVPTVNPEKESRILAPSVNVRKSVKKVPVSGVKLSDASPRASHDKQQMLYNQLVDSITSTRSHIEQEHCETGKENSTYSLNDLVHVETDTVKQQEMIVETHELADKAARIRQEVERTRQMLRDRKQQAQKSAAAASALREQIDERKIALQTRKSVLVFSDSSEDGRIDQSKWLLMASGNRWLKTLAIGLLLILSMELAIFLTTFFKFRDYLSDLDDVVTHAGDSEYWSLLKRELARFDLSSSSDNGVFGWIFGDGGQVMEDYEPAIFI